MTFAPETVTQLRWPSMSLLTALVSAALLLLALLFAYPLLAAVIRTIEDLPGALGELGSGLSSGTLQRVLGNTLIVVAGGAAIGTVFGTALAYINERTDANMGLFSELLPLAPLLVPSIAGVIGWAVLLDPRTGLINSSIRQLLAPMGWTMRAGPFNIYSAEGLVIMTGIYLVPYCYLVVAAALRRLDPSIEEASRVAGAGPLRTLLQVSVPAIRPAITNALVIAAVAGIGMFSVPIVLGTATRIEVLSVHVFRLLDSYPPHTAYALALSGMLMIGVQLLLLLQRLTISNERHPAVGGRGLRAGIRPLGRWKGPARSLLVLYIAITSVMPVAGLILVSLQSFWTPDIKWAQLSLANYSFVLLENGPTSRALITSVGLGAVTASVAVVGLGTILLHLRFDHPTLARVADVVISLPTTVPHTVIGASFLVAFGVAPFWLYGTLTILFLAYLLMGMPFAARTAAAAASAITKELVEASQVAGASETRTLARILLPLAGPGLLAGWIIVFIHTVGEVTASSLLAGARNPVVGRAITELWIFGSFPQVAALSLLVTVVTSTLVGLLLLLSRRNIASTLG
jgi:iron(III) transport system permease protein